MNDQSVGHAGRATAESACFIGSILDGPGHGLIVLRGHIEAAAVRRLSEHIDAFLDGLTRYLMVDARAVERYHPDLLDLLGDTQRRLAARRGTLEARGLHPTRLADPAPAGPDPDEADLVEADLVELAPAPDPMALDDAAGAVSCEADRRGSPRALSLTSAGRHHRLPDPHDATSPGEPGAHDRDGDGDGAPA